MIKYASNAFLPSKSPFINEIATVCEKVGADVQMVSKGMGLDNRIGNKFLHAGQDSAGPASRKISQRWCKPANAWVIRSRSPAQPPR